MGAKVSSHALEGEQKVTTNTSDALGSVVDCSIVDIKHDVVFVEFDGRFGAIPLIHLQSDEFFLHWKM